jgi:hypothetical protein
MSASLFLSPGDGLPEPPSRMPASRRGAMRLMMVGILIAGGAGLSQISGMGGARKKIQRPGPRRYPPGYQSVNSAP